MLLNGVLFLTTVWHESVLTTGLMLFPGPFMAAAFSVPSARLGARVGFRLPGTAGALLFCAASVWWIARIHGTPAYASEYLPGMLVSGSGVGLVIPTLTGAGAASLAPERFATGAAVLTMGRQVGSALGIAILVAVLGAGVVTLSSFDSAWLISAPAELRGGRARGARFGASGVRAPVRPPRRRARDRRWPSRART